MYEYIIFSSVLNEFFSVSIINSNFLSLPMLYSISFSFSSFSFIKINNSLLINIKSLILLYCFNSSIDLKFKDLILFFFIS